MRKIQILTFTALTLLLLTSLIALSVCATNVSTFTLSASSNQIKYDLPAGTTFNGSISTTGTIRFWVIAPNGAPLINLGLIDEPTSFSFVAQQTGNYTLNFENDLHNSVDVTFAYSTNPDISGGNGSGLPFGYLLIPAVVTIVGVILIFFFVRHRNKNQANTNRASNPIS